MYLSLRVFSFHDIRLPNKHFIYLNKYPIFLPVYFFSLPLALYLRYPLKNATQQLNFWDSYWAPCLPFVLWYLFIITQKFSYFTIIMIQIIISWASKTQRLLFVPFSFYRKQLLRVMQYHYSIKTQRNFSKKLLFLMRIYILFFTYVPCIL